MERIIRDWNPFEIASLLVVVEVNRRFVSILWLESWFELIASSLALLFE